MAWSQRCLWKTFANAVQMPAQRGQVFAAIYQVSPTWFRFNELPDTVMTPEAWQQTLASWSTPYHLIQAPDVGTSVSSLWNLLI